MALQVIINGQSRHFGNLERISLESLIRELALKGDRIAVERNGEIAERSRWREIEVVTGDRLEVVHFVGGGTFLP